ncbi:MAG TPA: hypothetical protein VE783_02235 [Candidatus Limnocylindrales bacterium]|jgi:uncharacterized membrane protein YqjE|nr:hypothetical protein [Candidatus Limnocylindrales bacterium]
MSTAAVLEPKAVEQAVKPQLTVVETEAAVKTEMHPLLVVGIAIVIALFGALTFVGSIIVWLNIRHSGVAHPLF